MKLLLEVVKELLLDKKPAWGVYAVTHDLEYGLIQIHRKLPLALKVYVILHELTHITLWSITGMTDMEYYYNIFHIRFDDFDYRFLDLMGLNQWVHDKYGI